MQRCSTASPTRDLSRLTHDQQKSLLALIIMREQIARLPEEDIDDLFILLREYCTTDSDEARTEAHAAITEILQPDDGALHSPSDDPSEALRARSADIGGAIRRRRREADLTQQQVAETCGIPQSHLSRIENGQHSPSHITLTRIAEALGAPISAFNPPVGD